MAVTVVDVGYAVVVTPYGLMQYTFPSFSFVWWQLMPTAKANVELGRGCPITRGGKTHGSRNQGLL